MGFHIFRLVASFFLTLNVCAVANGLSGFVASVSAGAFYLDYTVLDLTKVCTCNLFVIAQLLAKCLTGKSNHQFEADVNRKLFNYIL